MGTVESDIYKYPLKGGELNLPYFIFFLIHVEGTETRSVSFILSFCVSG